MMYQPELEDALDRRARDAGVDVRFDSPVVGLNDQATTSNSRSAAASRAGSGPAASSPATAATASCAPRSGWRWRTTGSPSPGWCATSASATPPRRTPCPTARQVGDPAGPTSIISLGPGAPPLQLHARLGRGLRGRARPREGLGAHHPLALPGRRRAHPRRHLHVPLPGHRPVAGRARPARRRRRAPDAAVPRAGHVLGHPRRPEHRVQARRRPAGPARRGRPRHLPAGARAPRPRGDREGHRARTPADGARPGARRRARPRPAGAPGGPPEARTIRFPGLVHGLRRRRRGPGAGRSRCRASSTTARCATGSTRSAGPESHLRSTPAASPSTGHRRGPRRRGRRIVAPRLGRPRPGASSTSPAPTSPGSRPSASSRPSSAPTSTSSAPRPTSAPRDALARAARRGARRAQPGTRSTDPPHPRAPTGNEGRPHRPPPHPHARTDRLVLVLSAGFAALEGYDLACYGVTVPSLLADRGFGADKAAAGTVGSLVAVGMLLGAATLRGHDPPGRQPAAADRRRGPVLPRHARVRDRADLRPVRGGPPRRRRRARASCCRR